MAKAKENKKHETLVVKGIIKKAYFGKTKFSEDEKNRITLYSEDFPYTDITAYDDTPDKLTPGWYKDQEGYCNLASGYEIEVMLTTGKVIDFLEWVKNYDTHNAEVSIKIRQKDGAIYPVALKVYKDGEPVDNFDGM